MCGASSVCGACGTCVCALLRHQNFHNRRNGTFMSASNGLGHKFDVPMIFNDNSFIKPMGGFVGEGWGEVNFKFVSVLSLDKE